MPSARSVAACGVLLTQAGARMTPSPKAPASHTLCIYPWRRYAKKLTDEMARRNKGRKSQGRAFQRQRRRMQHLEEERRQHHERRQDSSHTHTGKVKERMRRGTGMARAGRGMPMITRRRVDLASKPCPNSQADEHESKNLRRFAIHHGSHSVPLGEDLALSWLLSCYV